MCDTGTTMCDTGTNLFRTRTGTTLAAAFGVLFLIAALIGSMAPALLVALPRGMATGTGAGVGVPLLIAIVLVAHCSGLARLFRVELMCIARSVRCAATFGGKLALTLWVHRSEAAATLIIGLTAGLVVPAVMRLLMTRRARLAALCIMLVGCAVTTVSALFGHCRMGCVGFVGIARFIAALILCSQDGLLGFQWLVRGAVCIGSAVKSSYG